MLWIQVGEYFADVRVPNEPASGPFSELDQPQAFSGCVSYRQRTVTWRHDLDTRGRPPGYEDCAEIRRRGPGKLLERGAGYLELWRRESEPGGPTAVLERRDTRTGSTTGRVVMCGDLLVSVWGGAEPGGAALRYEDEGWDVLALVGRESIPWAAVSMACAGRAAPGWHQVA